MFARLVRINSTGAKPRRHRDKLRRPSSGRSMCAGKIAHAAASAPTIAASKRAEVRRRRSSEREAWRYTCLDQLPGRRSASIHARQLNDVCLASAGNRHIAYRARQRLALTFDDQSGMRRRAFWSCHNSAFPLLCRTYFRLSSVNAPEKRG